MRYNEYYKNESQDLQDRNFRKLKTFFVLVFWLVVFSPLWLWSFYILRKITGTAHPSSGEVLMIVGMSVLMYWLIFFLKGMAMALQERGNGLWLLLVALCAGAFAGVPGWMFYELFKQSLTTWADVVGAVLVVVIVYSHYRFHEPGATIVGRPAYQLGRWFAGRI